MVGRSRRVVVAALRWPHRFARAYRLRCAREDALRWHLVIPAGVWRCQRCPHVTFDVARLTAHYVRAHA